MTHTLDSAPEFDMKVSVHEHWRVFLIEGIVLAVLGAAAILAPALAGLAVAIFLGWLFLIGGFAGLITTLAARDAPGFWLSFISAIVTIVAGSLMIGWPIGGAISLTFVLTAFLTADGILMILFGLEHRRQLSGSWGWFLVNGVLDLVLAILIVWALRESAVWVLGLIVGIDMIFGGSSLISMALAARASPNR